MNLDQDDAIPESYYCPLTYELMVDPVIDPDGHSYERNAIEEWLRINPCSPITRNFLTVNELRPNRALKESIDKVRDRAAARINKPPQAAQPEIAAGQDAAVVEDEELDVAVVASGKNVLVRLIPPEGTSRSACDVVCVIDVSGSMNNAAELKTATGETESYGLTVLDIVKHAMRTIIATLGPQDRLAVVTFSNAATVLMELTSMSDGGRATAERVVRDIKANGSTNLWDGLVSGLDVLRKSPGSRPNRTVLLLTDGEPNIVPPRGHQAMLKNYMDANGLPGVICTFGFGYRLDSALLVDLAEAGLGSYSFIPDSSLVGTVLIHALTSMLATVANNVNVSLAPSRPQDMVGLVGTHPVRETTDGLEISFGSILYGQSKDIVIEFNEENFLSLNVTVSYKAAKSGKEKTKQLSVQSLSVQQDARLVEKQRLRLKFTDLVQRIMKQARMNEIPEASADVKKLAKEIADSAVAKDSLVKDLLKDVEGQVYEAISRQDWYDKWGKHYLPSLQGAHLLQQCNNFKDPGVQHYAGKLYKKLRDENDTTFLKLPPPVPSAPAQRAPSSSNSSVSTSVARSPSRPVSMSGYYSSSNPCFAGESVVAMADGSSKLVRDVKLGDTVASSLGTQAVVRCVVRTVCKDSRASLVALKSEGDGGLLVTPYHPVRLDSQAPWTFPIDLAPASDMPCEAVYSFVLEPSSTHKVMRINGIECVALAHHLTDSPVVHHDYFGTDKVLHDLERMSGWEEGLVTLQSGCLARDAATGRVIGLKQETA